MRIYIGEYLIYDQAEASLNFKLSFTHSLTLAASFSK